MKIEINEDEKQILNEVANIGFGNSSTALGQLLGKKVKIVYPEIGIIKNKDVFNIFDTQDVYIGVHMQVLEDLSGVLLCLFKQNESRKLVDEVIDKLSLKILDEDGISAIKEVSNILAGSYLNSLAKFSGLKLLPSLPHLAMDNAGSIFDFVTSTFKSKECEYLFVNSSLEIENSTIEGSILLVLEAEELKKLIDCLKGQYKTTNPVNA